MNIKPRAALKKLRYGSRLHPTRDWFVLCGIFLLLIVVSVLWNLVQFRRVIRGDSIGVETVRTQQQIDLSTVQELFVERAAERERYVNEYRFVDPSI